MNMICREVRRGWCAAKYIFSTFPSLLILILIQYPVLYSCTAVLGSYSIILIIPEGTGII